MANGMITIVKATAMATYVSRERAASLNGLLGVPTAIVRAAAPSMLAALWAATGNYLMGLAVLFALATLAAIAFWWAQRRALTALPPLHHPWKKAQSLRPFLPYWLSRSIRLPSPAPATSW